MTWASAFAASDGASGAGTAWLVSGAAGLDAAGFDDAPCANAIAGAAREWRAGGGGGGGERARPRGGGAQGRTRGGGRGGAGGGGAGPAAARGPQRDIRTNTLIATPFWAAPTTIRSEAPSHLPPPV